MILEPSGSQFMKLSFRMQSESRCKNIQRIGNIFSTNLAPPWGGGVKCRKTNLFLLSLLPALNFRPKGFS
jgi:hypothetical protein